MVSRKVIIVDFHAGHAREVTMQLLADIGTALAADGTPHEADVLGMFVGFFRRPGDILTAERVDGAWYCARGIGDFEINDPDQQHANEHWVGFRPFDVGGPWATVANADGVDIAHASFGNDSWRIADSLFDAEAAVTAVGQAFVVIPTNEVRMCVAYVAHADESAVYRAIPLSPAWVGEVSCAVLGKGPDRSLAVAYSAARPR